jgi:hypothetical protein
VYASTSSTAVRREHQVGIAIEASGTARSSDALDDVAVEEDAALGPMSSLRRI